MTLGPNANEDRLTAVRSLGPKDWLLAAALVAAVFLVYQPAWRGGFLLDDDRTLWTTRSSSPGAWPRSGCPAAISTTGR